MDTDVKISKQRVSLGTDIIRNLGLILLGNTLIAIAVNGIVIPHAFLSGGVTGTALLIHYLFSFLPVAALYLVLNIPLFAIGWAFVGRRFFIYSIIGMLSLTGTLEWVHVSVPLQDKLLAALFAGILTGIGGGSDAPVPRFCRGLGYSLGNSFKTLFHIDRKNVSVHQRRCPCRDDLFVFP